jgi:hypothetical protein
MSPVTGSKTYTIPFTPRQAGRHFLPAAHFSYFDPIAGKYVQLHTDSLRVDVQVAPSSTQSTAVNNRERTDASVAQAETRKFWMIPALVALGLALAGMAWWLSRKTSRQSAVPVQTLESFPEEAPAQVTQLSLFPAKHSLAAARGFLVMQDAPHFYSELLRIMRAVIAERYGIEALQSGAFVADALQSRFPGSSLPADLHRLIERCQMAVYAPLADPDEMEGDFRMAEQILDTLQAGPEGTAPQL